jgi:hypothetical protein
MRTGDPDAVREISRLLVSEMHGDGLFDGQLKEQMENEYGYSDVDSLAAHVDPPSEEELDRVSKARKPSRFNPRGRLSPALDSRTQIPYSNEVPPFSNR